MTLSALTTNPAPIAIQPALPLGHPFVARPGEWKLCLALVLLLSLFYLLIENGYWHAGADTAFYISLGRSLSQATGFRFNSLPIGKAPPLWPLLLAGAMKISTSFWFLNLIPAACLVGAAACWYWVMRRFVTPAQAFSIALLSGTLFFWYTSAVQLRTEALFCLLFASALLLALQVGEGRAQWWRIAAAACLCALAVGVRWVGLVCWLPVALAMLTGQLKPSLNRRCVGAALVAIITLSSFFAFQSLLKWLPAKELRFNNAAENLTTQDMTPDEIANATSETDNALSEDMDAPLTPAMQKVVTNPGFIRVAQRFGSSGKWISSIFWMPLYLGVTSSALGYLSNTIGWIAIALFLVCLVDHLRNRQWVLLGVLLFCGALVYRWRYPNPRYLVPIAPLLLLGCFLGIQILSQRCQSLLARRFWKFAHVLFIASFILCNGALWAVDVSIARSSHFYGRYLAGENDKLIAAAKYLNDHNLTDGQVAVSYYYTNLNRGRKNGQGLRSLHFLTNKLIRSAPKRLFAESPTPSPDLRQWAINHKVRYYLYRPPVSPWRAHHFRIAWWQRIKTGQKDIPHNPSWTLYDIQENRPVDLPTPSTWLTHVPGL